MKFGQVVAYNIGNISIICLAIFSLDVLKG